MEINLGKTKIIFFDRRSSPSLNNLASFTVNSHRVLGVYIDSRLSFNVHLNFLSVWIASRSYILARLRSFGVSETVLLRLALAFRMRLIYGTWWIFHLSASQFRKFESLWTKLVKKSMGFYAKVENDTILKFCGLDTLGKYLEYWFTVRSCEYKLMGLVDLFEIYERFEKNFHFKKSICRSSITDQTFNLYFLLHFYLPKSVISWYEKIKNYRARCLEIFTQDYKSILKRELLRKIIDKNIPVKSEIAKINKKFKTQYL